MNVELDYDDLKPGISDHEDQHGLARIVQVAAGVLLVAAGLVMMLIPGPGILTVLVGLNLIKPDNFIVRWIRKRVPGIPEEGAVPKRYLAVGAVFLVGSTVLSVLYGSLALDWARSLL